MGYTEATITDAVFAVGPDAEAHALRALADWLADEFGYDKAIADLDAALRLFGFGPLRDAQGELVSLEFEDQRLLAETEDFFITLAPHVRAGSYIDWRGGRGNRWQYRFDGARLRSVDLPDHGR